MAPSAPPRGRQKLEEDIEVKGMALEVDREALQLELVRVLYNAIIYNII